MKTLAQTVVSSIIKKRWQRHIAALFLQKIIITHLASLYPHIPYPHLFVQCKTMTIRILTHHFHLQRLIRLHRHDILTQWKHQCASFGLDQPLSDRLSFGDPDIYMQWQAPHHRHSD